MVGSFYDIMEHFISLFSVHTIGWNVFVLFLLEHFPDNNHLEAKQYRKMYNEFTKIHRNIEWIGNDNTKLTIKEDSSTNNVQRNKDQMKRWDREKMKIHCSNNTERWKVMIFLIFVFVCFFPNKYHIFGWFSTVCRHFKYCMRLCLERLLLSLDRNDHFGYWYAYMRISVNNKSSTLTANGMAIKRRRPVITQNPYKAMAWPDSFVRIRNLLHHWKFGKRQLLFGNPLFRFEIDETNRQPILFFSQYNEFNRNQLRKCTGNSVYGWLLL